MRVSDRLDLISKIGRELQSRYTFNELYSYLSAFDISYMEGGPTDSKWSYTKEALDKETNDAILRIAEDLEIAPPKSDAVSQPGQEYSQPNIWLNITGFRLFISHIAKDKDKAMRLKEALKAYSISAFVAHEDIQPTLEWQSEIECSLHAMEAMIAIHTKGFSQSFWTQQEIGFALGRDTKIISLKMGEDPTGFISKRQALARRRRNAEEIAAEINDLLYSDSRTNLQLEKAQKNGQSYEVDTFEIGPELTEALRHNNEIDIEAAGPKWAVSGYIYMGVRIESRWSVESELKPDSSSAASIKSRSAFSSSLAYSSARRFSLNA